MSKIRSKGTKIEGAMINALNEKGVKFVYQPTMVGNPDFLVEPSIVVFCDESFWHGSMRVKTASADSQRERTVP